MNYYGVQITDRMIHVSPLCPKIKCTRTRDAGTIMSYTTEADAIIDGHSARCPVCFNMMMFTLKRGSEQKHFLLDDLEVKVLVEMSNRAKYDYSCMPIVASVLNKSEREINTVFLRLRRFGLVSVARLEFEGRIKNLRRTTEWGHSVAIAYTAGIYGVQAEILNQQSLGPEYKRIA